MYEYYNYVLITIDRNLIMKLKRLLLLLILFALTVSTLASCGSCVSDKTSTGTKYDVMMIGDITGKDEPQTLEDISWFAVKGFTAGTNQKYKYFAPSEIEISNRVETEQKQREEAKRLSYFTQIQLAVSQRNATKSMIVLPGEDCADTYFEYVAKDEKYSKNYEGVWFLLPGVSSVHQAANVDNLAVKTVSLVINENELGQLYGYTAVKCGYKTIGYLGSDSEYSKSFKAGIEEGITKAKTEVSISDVSFTDNTLYDEDAKTRAISLYETCDIVIPENIEFSNILKETHGSKAFAAVETADPEAALSYIVNASTLTEIIQNTLIKLSTIGESKEVRTAGCADGIWSFAGGTNTSFTEDDAKAFMNTFKK